MSGVVARRRAVRAACLGLTALAAWPAWAQNPDPGDRTGPRATPPELPPFAEPEAQPQSLLPEAAVPQSPPPLRAVGTIREVRVAAEGDGQGAVPPVAWAPPADPVSGLRLEHRAGEPLDADWVRSQFALNMEAGGGAVSSAIALVQLINRAFLTAGFVNSGLLVPDQPALASGLLDLRLVHGRLAAPAGSAQPVIVTWAEGGRRGLDEAYILRRFPSARKVPLNAVRIERDFRLLAEDPAIRTISADLRPGDRPGEASLHLVVHPETPHDLYVGVANDRSPSVGGERVYAGGHLRNLLVAGDILTAEAGTTEGLTDAQFGYSVPAFGPRTFLSIRGGYNDAAVIDAPLVPLDIEAEDRSVQGGISHRFIEEPLTPRDGGGWSPSRTLTGGVQAVHRRQKSFLLGEPFSFAPGSVDGRTEYTALRLTGDYLMRNVDQVLAVSVTGTLGLGGTQSDIPSIPNPDDHFKALLVQLNYARRLSDDGLELRARLTGQYADGILYSGERLSIGGETSVRGYRENQFLVDHGLIGSLELALPFSLSGRSRSGSGWDIGAFTASVFTDAAIFGNEEPPGPGEDFISSVGVGLAWTPHESIFASISYAKDLVDVPLAGPMMMRDRDLQDRGIHLRIVIRPLRFFRR